MNNLGTILSINLSANDILRVNSVLGEGWTSEDFKNHVLEDREPPTPLQMISKTIIDNPEMTAQTIRQFKSLKDTLRNAFKN